MPVALAVPDGDHEPEMCRSRVSSSKESNKLCQELGWKPAQFCLFPLATAKLLVGPVSEFSSDVSFKVDGLLLKKMVDSTAKHQKNAGLRALVEL